MGSGQAGRLGLFTLRIRHRGQVGADRIDRTPSPAEPVATERSDTGVAAEFPQTSQAVSAAAYVGRTVVDPRGQPIGTVELVHLNAKTHRPEWITVRTDRRGKSRQHIAPLSGSTFGHDDLRLPYDPSVVLQAPRILDPDHMTGDDQFALYSYYLQNLAPSSPE